MGLKGQEKEGQEKEKEGQIFVPAKSQKSVLPSLFAGGRGNERDFLGKNLFRSPFRRAGVQWGAEEGGFSVTSLELKNLLLLPCIPVPPSPRQNAQKPLKIHGNFFEKMRKNPEKSLAIQGNL
ncbi:hypothetical protein [Clostridium sp. M62/1]|uniref:hypothetical protein n=1 Tax=Clostridium sp. M62/1 TaxID=411486 RepID=UPI00356A629C